MVTGETKSFFSFAKSVSQRYSLSSIFELNRTYRFYHSFAMNGISWQIKDTGESLWFVLSTVVAGGEGQPY